MPCGMMVRREEQVNNHVYTAAFGQIRPKVCERPQGKFLWLILNSNHSFWMI